MPDSDPAERAELSRPVPDRRADQTTDDQVIAAAPDDAPVAVEMLAVNARAVVLAGSVAFAVAFVVLLPFWSWLGDHHHRVWLWTSLSGALLGFGSLPLVDRHRAEGRQG